MSRNASIVLAGSVALTLLACLAIVQHLKVDTDFRALLPPEAPSIEALDDAGQRFGAISPLVLLVTSDTPEALERLRDPVARELEAIEGVAEVIHSPHFSLRNDTELTLAYILRLRSELTDVAEHQAWVERTEAALDRAQVPISMDRGLLGGLERQQAELAVLVDEMALTSLVSLVAILTLLTGYFRRLRALLYLGLPLLMGVCWTLGFAALSVGSLNLISGFVAALLMGLGIDVGIHVLCRFDDERRAGHPVRDALRQTLRTTGRATLLAALTTACVFFVMATSSLDGFADLGIIAGVGILLMAAAFLLTLPALIALLESWRPAPPPARRTTPTLSISRRVAVGVVGSGALVGGLGLLTLPELGFDEDFARFEVDLDATAMQPYERARAVLGDTASSSTLLLTESPEDAQRLSALLREQPLAEVEKVVSVHRPGAALLPAWVTRLLREVGPRGSGDAERVLLVYPAEDMRQGPAIRAFKTALAERIKGAELGGPVVVASPAFILTDLYDALRGESRRLFALALVVVLVMTLVMLRRVGDVLMAVLPLVMGAAWVVGGMALFDLELDMFNLASLLILIGLGVDDGIHLVHRLRHSTVAECWTQSGPPVALTSLTTGVAFGSLIGTSHAGLQSLGVLAVLGIAATTVVALVVLPAVAALRVSASPRRA